MSECAKRARFNLTSLLTFHPSFGAGLRAVNRQSTGSSNSQNCSTAKLGPVKAQGRPGNGGTGRQRMGPARRSLPICALTKHRAPSWSPDRRSRASEASSPVTQPGQGLRPPDPASCKPTAATSTATLNSPRLGERRFAFSHFRQWLYQGQEVLPLSDGGGVRRGRKKKDLKWRVRREAK